MNLKYAGQANVTPGAEVHVDPLTKAMHVKIIGDGSGGTERSVSVLNLTGPGTIAAGATSVNFFNSGAGNAIIQTNGTLFPNQAWPIMATGADTLAAITYNFTGTTGTVTVLR